MRKGLFGDTYYAFVGVGGKGAGVKVYLFCKQGHILPPPQGGKPRSIRLC